MSISHFPHITASSCDALSAESPKYFKENVFKFLQPEGTSISPRLKKDLINNNKFIPYVNERDHLGVLLSKRSRRSPLSPSKESITLTKIKSFEEEGGEIHFENFKYKPKLPFSSVKSTLKKLVRHTEKVPSSSSSPCFLSTGRPEVKPIERAPGVGYYESSDKLVHPRAPAFDFPRKNKWEALSKRNLITTEDTIDVVRSFNSVCQTHYGTPDFMRQTTRENHFLNKYKDPLQTKSKTEIIKLEKIREQYYVKGKNNHQNDTETRFRSTYQVSPKAIPLTQAALDEKFGLTKQKYKIYTFSLK